MAEAPQQTPELRAFTAASLTEQEIHTITGLVKYLAENSYAYDSHVQLINLLHKGFIAHVYGTSNLVLHDPRDYNLLPDMRQAREAMDSRFAVGEDIWKDWISDEALLARQSEERVAVMDLCQKAVLEEPTSVTLWTIYGEWVMQIYSIANGFVQGDPDVWTDIDKEICKEVFSREICLDVWERAVEATAWRIDESHRVWDRYIALVLQEFPDNPSPQAIEHVNTIFMRRLQIPHSTWSETSAKFWPIVSKFNASNWEEIMAATNEMAGPAKQQFALRENHELNVRRAAESGDNTALYNAFTDYLTWERKNKRRSPFDFELRCSLYERALLRFPTVIEWWFDLADFVLKANSNNLIILSIMERATRHCPWSGDLWSRRILRAEVDKLPYDEVEQVKHKATNSGLLDIGGMEEVLKVYSSWCGYLRRRAFAQGNTDDEIDMADMGITGTLEDATVAGKKIYGNEYKGDPRFRLEQIRVKFLLEARRYQDARMVYERMIPTHAASADFWLASYRFEILVWSHERMCEAVCVETPETAPHRATAVLREALKQRNLDWPEKILEVWLDHFHQNETPEALQQAQADARTAQFFLAQRRAREAAEAAAAAAEAQPQVTELNTISEETSTATKRKREDGPGQVAEEAVKRNKTDQQESATLANSEASAPAQIKRDREHTTITVKDLPTDVSETRIRQFFSDCGTILSVGIVADDNAMTSHATIEFETEEDVLSAKTRDGKSFDGNTIRIQSGTLSTLYVTNYPADWDEIKIREMFHDFGTIVSVRLPSLKYNSRRRFCYVQFLTAEEARAATSMNDKALDGQHRLVALISDPGAKKGRSGAVTEGRELHVANIDNAATESDLRNLFKQHGTVENVRMMKKVGGKFIGTAFIVFSKAEEAEAAVTLNNKPLLSRLLRVSIATDKSATNKESTAKVIEKSTGDVAARETKHASTTEVAKDVSIAPDNQLGEETAKTIRERTVALLNLPDTVNDARVQSFLESHGAPLRKLTMRRDKGGAIVEFVNIKDAGKIGMGIDCSSLGPETRIGGVDELLHKRGVKPAFAPAPKPITSLRPAQAGLSRPAQRGGGGGGGGQARRGGLGFRRGGAVAAAAAATSTADGGAQDQAMGESGETSAKAKSNDDFRALFTKSKSKDTHAPPPAAED
jgi:RNA recognition motif-containing protein